MQYEGMELRELIGRTANLIEVHNVYGRCCQKLCSAEALTLDLNFFVGVGNRRRLRYLRPRERTFQLNSGSRTTRRVKDEAGKNISHPFIREHRLPRGVVSCPQIPA